MPGSDNLSSMADDGPDAEPIGRPGRQFEEHPENDEHRDLPSPCNGDDDDDDDFQVFSPTDGYFHSASVNGIASVSSNVPHVPNVWVRDPSLEQESTADGKAREAYRETLANSTSLNPRAGSRLRPSGSEDGPSAYTYQPSHRSAASISTRATHHHPSSAANTSSPTESYTSNTAQQRFYNPHTPAFPRDAPPAYTPSPTTSPTSRDGPPAVTDLTRNYHTFLQSRMRRDETQGLLADSPESMGGRDDDFDGVTPAWRERARRRLPYLNGRNCRVMLIGLALLAITLGFLVSVYTSIRNEETQRPSFENSPGAQRPDPEPVTEPPPVEYPGLDGETRWPGSNNCKDLTVEQPSRSFDLSYGAGSNVSLVQDVEEDDTISGRDIRVCGDVVFRRSGEGTPGPSVVLDVITNDERIEPKIQFIEELQTLHVTVPRKLPWGETSTRPCMKIQATVWVPAGGVLDTLFVETVHLGIRLLDNLSLRVAQATRLTTAVGPVVAAENTEQQIALENNAPAYFNFDSRWIEVRTTSAQIKGHWPLYDYLGLHSTSGDIVVGIQPKPVDKDAPKPAVLFIKSLSGDVEFHEPIRKAIAASQQSQSHAIAAPEVWIPPRDYRSNIQTTSGVIRGSLAFSTASRFHSTSGSMDIELLPVLNQALSGDDECAQLETSSTSGWAAAQIHEPLWIETSQKTYPSLASTPGGNPQIATIRALRCLRSRHTTTSASISLHYPTAWEGDLDLRTMTGKLTVWGKDVKKIKEGSDWPGVNKQLLARKGAEGGSYVMAKTISGNIEATVD